jgi:GxxExxY protein
VKLGNGDLIRAGRVAIDDPLTERIIAAFFCVYNELGYRLLEGVYHRAMMVELSFSKIPFRSEVPIELFHRGVNIGDYRVDLIVADSVIVECKAVDKLLPVHASQVRTYLKAANLNTGLVLNFGPEPKVRRVHRF